jgi:hypothetical protein
MSHLPRLSVACVLAIGLSASHTSALPDQHEESTASPCRSAGPAIALAQLPEASGLAASRRHPGVLWSHNDSGMPMVFAIGTDGSIKGRVRIAGAELDDWEDVAVGACPAGSCLYVADIGDNHGSRKNVTVYRVPEPAPGDNTSKPAEAFHATYPDGPRDAEAIFVTSANDVFLISKDEPVGLYRFPRPLRAGATVRLEKVAALGHVGGRVTAADASPDGRWVVARTHRAVIFYRASELTAGTVREAARFDLSPLGEPQGEGVALLNNGTVYLSGEGGASGTLARVNCSLPR